MQMEQRRLEGKPPCLRKEYTMNRPDNYQIQAQQAKARFLTYDQERLIRKLGLDHDGEYLYITMLSRKHRIRRDTGDMEKLVADLWVDANSHGEVMTVLDLICDSREDRSVSGKWKAMGDFGRTFHRNLLERADPWADQFAADPEGFRRACETLGGKSFPTGDIAYVMDFFDGLQVLVQLWFAEEEFPAGLRLLWDENALQYIKYETMYFAKGILLHRLKEIMET